MWKYLERCLCFFILSLFLFQPQLSFAKRDDVARVKKGNSCEMCDLRYADFSKANIAGIKLPGSFMYGANLSWSNLSSIDFESASLSSAIIEWSNVDNAVFNKSNLEDATFFRSSIREGQFQMIKGGRVKFSNAVLTQANFSASSLINSNFSGAEAESAIFRSADLSSADFSKADLRNASFKSSKLLNANLKGIRSKNADFSNSHMQYADLSYTNLVHVNFRNSNLEKANFGNSLINGVNFTDSDLQGANFLGATFSNVIFKDANLCGALMPDGKFGSCASKGMKGLNDTALYGISKQERGLNEKKIRIAIPGNMYADLNLGKPRGVIAEALSSVLNKLDITASYIVMSSSEAKEALDSGVVSLALSSLVFENAEGQTRYSKPLIQEYLLLLSTTASENDVNRISDMAAYHVGGREGYRYPTLDKHSDIVIEKFQKDGDIIRSLLLGDIDFALISSVSDISLFRSESIMQAFKTEEKAVGHVDLGIEFSESLPTELIVSINKELQVLMESKEWENILDRNGLADLVRDWQQME